MVTKKMKQSEIAKRLEAILSENETYASYTDEHILPVPQITTDALADQVRMIAESMVGLKELMMVYSCAIKEMRTKFDVLNTEFSIRYRRNPIYCISSRLKRTASIVQKMERLGLPLTLDSVEKHLHDVAGVRVICSYRDDIYRIADALLRQNDVELIERKDYILNPKPNGYRSLHLIVSIPVFFANAAHNVKVEVQIRTIAMDYWASLEHQLKYKQQVPDEDRIAKELYECAETLAATDAKMLSIRRELELCEESPDSDTILLEKLQRIDVTV